MTDQEAMNAGWKAHRASTFRISRAGGGILVVDSSRTPPRAWAARMDGASLRVRTAGVAGLEQLEPAEVTFARVWSGEGLAARDLPPPEAAALMGAVPGAQDWSRLSVQRFSEGLDARMRARIPMERMQVAEETRLAAAGLGALREGLDMEALALLSACEDYGWKDYAYYAVNGPEGSLEAARRTVRHQAAKAYPMMAAFIANRFGTKADLDKQARFLVQRAPLKAAMDAARAAGDVDGEAQAKAALDALVKPPALLDSLERALTPSPTREQPEPQPTVSRSALGRIGGVKFGPRGLRADYVAMRMSELPPDWFPKKGADWKEEEWVAFTDLISTVGPRLGRLTGAPPEVLYEGCAGRWADLRDRVVRAFTDSRPPAGMQPEELAVLEAQVDWVAVRALPRHKVEAAAQEMASRLEVGLPEGVDTASVADWIVRIVAPPFEREVIHHACAEAEMAAGILANKVMLPLACYLTGDADPMLNAEQLDLSASLAARVLFGGKGAVKVFETLAEFHKNGAAIQGGGSVLPHESDAEAARNLAERKEAIKRAAEIAAKTGTAAAVGVDLDATRDFPIPFDPVIVAPNGVRLCTLFNWAQFQDEGRGFRGDQFGAIDNRVGGTAYGHRDEERCADGSYGLNICVGMYTWSYDGGKNGRFCISARVPHDVAGDGAPYTRLSLNSLNAFSKSDKGWTTTEREHKGSMNTKPCELSLEAFQWFFEGVKSGTIPHNLASVEEQVALTASKMDRIEDICGYDWEETPRIGAALRPWSSVLPKRARGPVARFSALPEVQALADNLSPGWKHKAEMRSASWGKSSYVVEEAASPSL